MLARGKQKYIVKGLTKSKKKYIMQLWLDCAKAGDYFSDAATIVEETKNLLARARISQLALK